MEERQRSEQEVAVAAGLPQWVERVPCRRGIEQRKPFR
jgi:hypothetical protein